MKRISLILTIACSLAFTSNAEKKVLGHDDFDRWEKVTNNAVSNNGEWTVFAVNPQEDDGVLTFYNTKTLKKIDIKRGYSPKFTADSKWGVALIKAPYQETRQAKIKKKKDLQLPQDSLVIVNLTNGELWKTPNVKSYKIGKDGGEWIAWLSVDTAYTPKKVLEDKKAGKTLVVRRMVDGLQKILPNVGEYNLSDNGMKLGVTLKKTKKDTTSINGVGILLLPDTTFRLLSSDLPFYGVPQFDIEGNSAAYISSTDSAETGTKKTSLFLTSLKESNLNPKEIKISNAADGKGTLFLNQYSTPSFSHNGKRLIIGVAPVIAPNDTTLVDFEKASLDIWRWDAPLTPPQELNMVEVLRKRTFPVVIDLSTGSQVLITDNQLCDVKAPDRWDADWALVTDRTENFVSQQWDYTFGVKLKIKNVLTGETKDVADAWNGYNWISPSGKYVVWYKGRQYYVYDISTGEITNPSAKVPYPIWDETQDTPGKELSPYGIMGWSKDDGLMLIYDRFDVWALDPKGIKDPVCITAGEGRKRNIQYRMERTNPDQRYLTNGDRVLYSMFDIINKYGGFAYATFSDKAEAPKDAFLEPMSYKQLMQGKDSGTYSWIQGNFSISPNVYFTRDITKKNNIRVTDSNPQMGDYSWGTAQLFRWYAYNGAPSEGVLYLPEDFDPNKGYPMIAYFYEIYSDHLYNHFDMEPSWSWINIPFYVSRGYVVFLPDIHYTAGVPGECAYNYVCSGVEEVCRQFPNIDKKRIGIDGQSWGGYQTAYLVTRTNMFACAGSGAPVSNMTSAFGGIRWESGSSRQAQYEQGQSRIGRNLWEAPALYLANSPVFNADRVETPLLIMHNDADGAVPWYQGIEMFMALRRLGKPVWMLQYNSEAHNLRERRNRKDITKRLQQFFDHYLKGDPMPEWMKNGIPAVRKGQDYGFSLESNN